MFRKALLLLSGNALAALLTLVRNLLIAHLISVENYGIAATFAIAMAVVEMASALGMEQQIVQSRRGDDPVFQAEIQGFTVARGVMSFIILLLTAGWMARFLGVPDLAWAYQVMAFVPLIRAFAHFDNHWQKRRMRFGPSLWTQVGSAVAAVLVIWPLFFVWPDYRMMLASLVVQALVSTAITHALAERPYRLRFDLAAWGQSTRFGWPLLVNGVLLFAVMHGEKLIAGRYLGLEELGIIAMGLTLTMTPTLVLARSLQNLFLPRLSAAEEDTRFYPLALVAIQSVLAIGLIYLLGMFVIGGPLSILLLGEKYAALPALMIWLAVQQTLRLFKASGATVALARGQTANAMIANIVRVLSLPVAVWVALEGGGLLGIVFVATLGEAAGVVLSLLLVMLRLRVSARQLALPICGALGAVTVTTLVAWRADPAQAAFLPPVPDLALVGGAILAALLCQTHLRRALTARTPLFARYPKDGRP